MTYTYMTAKRNEMKMRIVLLLVCRHVCFRLLLLSTRKRKTRLNKRCIARERSHDRALRTRVRPPAQIARAMADQNFNANVGAANFGPRARRFWTSDEFLTEDEKLYRGYTLLFRLAFVPSMWVWVWVCECLFVCVCGRACVGVRLLPVVRARAPSLTRSDRPHSCVHVCRSKIRNVWCESLLHVARSLTRTRIAAFDRFYGMTPVSERRRVVVVVVDNALGV